jgi:hypothetical protein
MTFRPCPREFVGIGNLSWRLGRSWISGLQARKAISYSKERLQGITRRRSRPDVIVRSSCRPRHEMTIGDEARLSFRCGVIDSPISRYYPLRAISTSSHHQNKFPPPQHPPTAAQPRTPPLNPNFPSWPAHAPTAQHPPTQPSAATPSPPSPIQYPVPRRNPTVHMPRPQGPSRKWRWGACTTTSSNSFSLGRADAASRVFCTGLFVMSGRR